MTDIQPVEMVSHSTGSTARRIIDLHLFNDAGV